MKLLLAFGAEVNARNGNGSTALHRACHKNNVAAVQLLLAHGADYTIRDRVSCQSSDHIPPPIFPADESLLKYLRYIIVFYLYLMDGCGYDYFRAAAFQRRWAMPP
jgi:ankyrin repeat protein